MRVLIADKFEQTGIGALQAASCDVVYEPDLKEEALVDAIGRTEAEVLVVRSTQVTEPMLDAGRLALVVRAGAGYNTIDVAAASTRGIYVSNCPGKNSISVAELTMGLILALDRRIPDGVADLRAGTWNKKDYAKAAGLFGRTLGVLGAGAIAREVIKRAAACGMAIVLWSRRFNGEDRPLTDEELAALDLEIAARQVHISLAPSPKAVAERCDVLTVHLALSPDTRGVVGGAVLARLKPGALFVNTSRGELVDEAALLEAVQRHGIRAGLDVYCGEPSSGTGTFSSALISSGVYGTHHIGASTNQAQEAIAAETVRIVLAYRDTGQVPNVVNLARRSPATHMLVIRHRDRPGVLAHVFDVLRDRGINVQETENVVFEGAEAAVARVNLGREPDGALLDTLRRGNANIFDLQVVSLS
ncbi:MAG: ACT domain-containing protein [Luteitalea sp.]|nr:ACT domain-containing protein [Luteitalea sp.]